MTSGLFLSILMLLVALGVVVAIGFARALPTECAEAEHIRGKAQRACGSRGQLANNWKWQRMKASVRFPCQESVSLRGTQR